MSTTYQNITTETEGPVAIARLNRPEKRNILSPELMHELVDALEKFDRDEHIRCIIITGDEKAFSAGADIKGMAKASAVDMILLDMFGILDRIRKISKPIIAAISGFALGGGLELAMNCDIIVASETAKLGLTEINIGVMPGTGGTQRLTRIIGKHKSMEMILTGKMIGAEEAEKHGLVNRITPPELYLEEAKKLAREISSRPPLAVRLAKEAILRVYDTSLEAGLDFERKCFYLLFDSEDKKEGMQAFMEKRSPTFKGR